MRESRGAAAIVAAAFVLAASAASGQPGEGPPPRDRGEGMTHELGLSQAQQDRVREILDEQRPQRDQLHEKMSANRDALHELLESGSADAAAVGQLVLEGRRLREESRALRDAQLRLLRDLRAGRVTINTPAGAVSIPEHPVFWAGFALFGEPE